MYFSQHGEDKILYEKYFSKFLLKDPIYFEAGALDGIKYSNTKFFEDTLGWSGLLVEPHPINYEQLKINRPNNFLFNNLISNSAEALEFVYYENFNLSAVSGVQSTITDKNKQTFFENSTDKWISKMNNQSLKKMKIKPKTLSEIVTSTGVDHIDFFSLDVEGHEMQVLHSYDWTIPIHSIFVESNNNFQELSNFLKEKGYHYIESITNNFLFFDDTFMQIYSDNQ